MASETAERLKGILSELANPIVARGVLRYALHQCSLAENTLSRQDLTAEFVEEIERGLKVMSSDTDAVPLLRQALRSLLPPSSSRMRPGAEASATRQEASQGVRTRSISHRRTQRETIEIRDEIDIVRARGRARGFAQTVGFGSTDQTKIATAVSEVSRNIYVYAREGTVSLLPLMGRKGLRIEARDKGPGIGDLKSILAGHYASKTGMGLGLRGCQRLMDHFEVETGSGEGTVVIMEKELA